MFLLTFPQNTKSASRKGIPVTSKGVTVYWWTEYMSRKEEGRKGQGHVYTPIDFIVEEIKKCLSGLYIMI